MKIFVVITLRKSLQSLQHAGGAYCVVTAHKDHDVRGSLRVFIEGDNLRILRAKEEKVGDVVAPKAQLPHQAVPRCLSYALRMTWDVPVAKAMGILKVNICWHETVFRNEWRFTESNFLF
jgi:hypothetical protein